MNGIISAIPNNWKQNIMGETMMHVLICNEIAEKHKRKTNIVHILTTYLSEEFDKSLLCVIKSAETI
jgi:Na+/serine symporter